jgi:hypothetical protein
VNTFESILKAALGRSEDTVPASTSLDVKSKGTELAGTIEIRMKNEVSEDEIVEQAVAAASRRIDDIISGIISQDVLSGQFFTSTTRTRKVGEVDIPTKLAGLQGANGKFMSALNLSRILNLTLFEQVKGLMEEPALVYRTGRFAQSAHINGIVANTNQVKSRGSIYFSYMLFPYAVFAGHPDRDPASLIREAISMALRKALSPSSFKRSNFNIQERS